MDNLEIFNDLETHFKSYNESEVKSVTKLTEALSYYKECITTFFSQNGEASAIREMYKKIRALIEDGQEIMVPCIDIDESYRIYQEYLDGMSQFINEINNSNCCVDETSVPILKNNLEKAIGNDETFVNSLYNGNLSKITDRSVQEAISVVEYLIDFIQKMGELSIKCNNVSNTVTQTCECDTKTELITQSFSMLCGSVNRFCYCTINNIFKTYLEIKNAIYKDNEISNTVTEEAVLL